MIHNHGLPCFATLLDSSSMINVLVEKRYMQVRKSRRLIFFGWCLKVKKVHPELVPSISLPILFGKFQFPALLSC